MASAIFYIGKRGREGVGGGEVVKLEEVCQQIISGATAHHLNLTEAKKLAILLSPLPDQCHIVKILGAAYWNPKLERRRKEKLEKGKEGADELTTDREEED